MNVDPGTVLQHLRGPVKVIVVGNPFRYPFSVTVNNKTLTGSTIDKALVTPNFQTTPSGTQTEGPFSINPTPGPSDPPNPFSIPKLLQNPMVSPQAPATCGSVTSFTDIENCASILDRQVTATIDAVNTSWRTVCSAQLEYLALQTRADIVVNEINAATDDARISAKSKFSGLLASEGSKGPMGSTSACGNGTPLAQQASSNQGTQQGSSGSKSTTEGHGQSPATMPIVNTPGTPPKTSATPVPGTATVPSTQAAISRVVPFPAQAISDEQTAITNLQGIAKSKTTTDVDNEQLLSSDGAILACVDRTLGGEHPQVAPLVKNADSASVAFSKSVAKYRKNYLIAQTAQSKFKAAETDANGKIRDQANADVASAAKSLDDLIKKETLTPSTRSAIGEVLPTCKPTQPRISSKSRIDDVNGHLARLSNALAIYAANSPYAAQAIAAQNQLAFLQSTVLSNASVSRLFVEFTEDCTNISGTSRSTTIVVQRFWNETNSVVVDCPPRIFTTGGFAFGSHVTRTYTPVPSNSALPQAPGATPPPATIGQSTTSDVLPVPVVMLNVRFQPSEGPIDNDLYLSFGVSLGTISTTGPNSLSIPIEFLGGLSYSLSHQFLVTGGALLAPETSLAPGYALGDPVAATGIQTTTRTRLRPFLAITYGPH